MFCLVYATETVMPLEVEILSLRLWAIRGRLGQS
jgi:hypothetical protein